MGQYQSGGPLAWGNIFFDGNIQDIVLPSDRRSVNEWFNTNAGFVKASSLQPADNIRAFPTGFAGIRAPSSSTWNASVVKNFRAKEWLKVQLRGEFYNLFNRPDLSAPNTTPTSTAFGQITSTLADSNARWAMIAMKVMF